MPPPSPLKLPVTHLYRSILHQIRLLCFTFSDPILYQSHRYLARKTLQPIVKNHSSLENQTNKQKKTKKAVEYLRQLADANVGWPHAVYRVFDLAYARKGRLRREILSMVRPERIETENENKYPTKLRKKEVHPVLQTWISKTETIRGSASSLSHFLRPPPPYLPALDDPLISVFKKKIGRRREINAWKRWFKTQVNKVILPIDIQSPDEASSLFQHLESRAQKIHPYMPNRLKRELSSKAVEKMPSTIAEKQHETETCESQEKNEKAIDGSTIYAKKPSKINSSEPPRYLETAKREAHRYSSNVKPQAIRSHSMRVQGWTRAPRDFSRNQRLRRRVYARLLESSPLMVISNTTTETEEEKVNVGKKSKPKTTLPIVNKLQHLLSSSNGTASPPLIKLVKSTHALMKKEPRGALPGSEQCLSSEELEFLQRSGLL